MLSTRKLCSWAVGPMMLCLAGTAGAEESQAPKEAAPEAQPTGSSTPADLRREGDASVDRNILMPSAETINAGDITFNSYELVFAGLTYGATDDIAVSLTVLLPIVEDFPRYASLTGKFRLFAASNDIVSLQPNLMYFGVEGESAGIFGAHLLYDHIWDQEGRYTSTLAASALGVLGATGGDVNLGDGAILGFSGAFNARVGSIVKLMGELYLPGAITPDRTELLEEGLLFNYGVRFFSHTIAVDLTFLRPIHPDAETPFVMGIPFVTFSARF